MLCKGNCAEKLSNSLTNDIILVAEILPGQVFRSKAGCEKMFPSINKTGDWFSGKNNGIYKKKRAPKLRGNLSHRSGDHCVSNSSCFSADRTTSSAKASTSFVATVLLFGSGDRIFQHDASPYVNAALFPTSQAEPKPGGKYRYDSRQFPARALVRLL